jgi:hypothetical protein
MDTCKVQLVEQAPVAHYFVKDYGKVPMQDSRALMLAVSAGPVALGKQASGQVRADIDIEILVICWCSCGFSCGCTCLVVYPPLWLVRGA